MEGLAILGLEVGTKIDCACLSSLGLCFNSVSSRSGQLLYFLNGALCLKNNTIIGIASVDFQLEDLIVAPGSSRERVIEAIGLPIHSLEVSLRVDKFGFSSWPATDWHAFEWCLYEPHLRLGFSHSARGSKLELCLLGAIDLSPNSRLPFPSLPTQWLPGEPYSKGCATGSYIFSLTNFFSCTGTESSIIGTTTEKGCIYLCNVKIMDEPDVSSDDWLLLDFNEQSLIVERLAQRWSVRFLEVGEHSSDFTLNQVPPGDYVLAYVLRTTTGLTPLLVGAESMHTGSDAIAINTILEEINPKNNGFFSLYRKLCL